MPYQSERSIPEVMADLLWQFPELIRKEAQLARAEISAKISQIAVAIGLAIFGAVLLIPALVILLEAGVDGIERGGLPRYAAALIAGGGALLIGLILVAIGIGLLRPKRLVPNKTISQIQEDALMAKRQMRSDHEQDRAA